MILLSNQEYLIQNFDVSLSAKALSWSDQPTRWSILPTKSDQTTRWSIRPTTIKGQYTLVYLACRHFGVLTLGRICPSSQKSGSYWTLDNDGEGTSVRNPCDFDLLSHMSLA